MSTSPCAHQTLSRATTKSRGSMCAGQAVVQFATDIRTEREYAIKFFATRDAFIDEAALYSDSQNPLNKLLPRVREICDNVDGRVTDASGEALPPCIIMEKGEALNIWSRRNKGGLDHMTALQVRSNTNSLRARRFRWCLCAGFQISVD